VRILTFTSLFPNAIQPSLGIFVYQRVAPLARQGNSVEVIAPVPYAHAWLPSDRWKKMNRIANQERIGNLEVYHPRYLLVPKVSMPWHGWLMHRGSLRVARQLHRMVPFDCIDAHYVYPDGFAAILTGKALGIPVFLSARGTDLNVFPAFRMIRPMIRWSLERAAGIITVSSALKDAVLQLGASPDRVRVIPNGVDLGRFYPIDRSEARRTLRLPGDARIIVSVGGLAAHKGFLSLVRAVATLVPRIPELKLYIVGEGPLRKELEQEARTLVVESNVQLVGSCNNDRLVQWYNAADLMCLASTREGLPNVVLESLACGTPLVATRVGGIPEVITSPQLGVLVGPDLDSLVAGLETALRTTWDREELARAGRSRTWETVAEEVRQFFASRMTQTTSS
jgi:teichuronic acid biosynthesis glycosyltransferase TuaC